MKQEADENCDVVSGKQVWKCDSSKSITTVSEYARYQQKILHKEIEVEHNTLIHIHCRAYIESVPDTVPI